MSSLTHFVGSPFPEIVLWIVVVAVGSALVPLLVKARLHIKGIKSGSYSWYLAGSLLGPSLYVTLVIAPWMGLESLGWATIEFAGYILAGLPGVFTMGFNPPGYAEMREAYLQFSSAEHPEYDDWYEAYAAGELL